MHLLCQSLAQSENKFVKDRYQQPNIAIIRICNQHQHRRHRRHRCHRRHYYRQLFAMAFYFSLLLSFIQSHRPSFPKHHQQFTDTHSQIIFSLIDLWLYHWCNHRHGNL